MKTKHSINPTLSIPGFTMLELICESPPHVLFRAKRQVNGSVVVLKTLLDKYPKKEHLASLKREYQIIRQLQKGGVITCFSLVPHGNGNLAIELEPFGISLEQYVGSLPKKMLPLHEFVDIAPQLVSALGKVHEAGFIHKDIAPRNVLINPETKEIRLIDFSSSSELSREHQEGNYSTAIVGSLPYMSPEQTGRMNRDIDYRSDYYALGITFFELLTGQLPFLSKDPLELVHSHISKAVPAPKSLNPAIASAISKCILKLVSKNAEERYQSGFGLQLDLEQMQRQLKDGQKEFDFPLAQSDKSRQFHIPQKLYGREFELRKLEDYFQRAVNGSVEFCLVSGYSGVGKSMLVHELGRSIIRKRGYLIHGKFDQYRQNSSYMGLANAFRDLIKYLLGESREKLADWSAQLKKALDPNGQLIVDLIPELELIIGKQPALQELSPAESQNRFMLLFLNFVRVFATEKHPLVIFLDDLQWSDIPTLNLIHRLVLTQELDHLMLIGAFRNNAVDAAHPLSLTLEEIKKKRPVDTLELAPLSMDAVNEIIKDTLRLEGSRSEELSTALHEKTGGNPFFTMELLKSLFQRKVIQFNESSGNWDWDLSAVKSVEHTDNVIEFLLAGLKRLPESTQNVLQLAACIGANFDLRTLSIIREGSMERTASELYQALKSNIVIPLSENYKLVGLDPAEPLESQKKETLLLNPNYKFQHDRVQQAAYSMILPEKRKALHLSIGRLIRSHTSEEMLDEVLMDVVGHLNEGRELLQDPAEKLELAKLNLEAGVKAKLSSAYESSLIHLKISQELMPADAWEQNYPLMWRLSEELQSSFYLTGDWDQADQWTEVMLQHAQSLTAQALVYSARTRQYATMGKMQESIKAAYEGLSALGFHFAKVPENEEVEAEVAEISINLAGRTVSSLIEAPPLTDEKAKIASQLLMEIFPAAFLSGSGKMFPYLVLKSVNIALRYGNSPETAFAYAGYAMILSGYFHDPVRSYEFGQLAVNLIEKLNNIPLKSRIIYVYTMFVHHWSNHWSTMTPWFRKAIDAGYQSGDLLYLAYSAQDCIIWDPKLDLETASQEQRRLLNIVKECDYQDSLDSGTLFLQMQLNFQGLTDGPFSLTDHLFDEEKCLQGMSDRHFMTGIANYHIYKSEIHLLYNDPKGAIPHIVEQEKLMPSVMSLPQSVRFQLVSFLIRAMVLSEYEKEDREPVLQKMYESLEKMKFWANQCPDNFQHLVLLMQAELEGIADRVSEALDFYEKAIASAQKSSFIRDEAMANELAARFLLRLGLAKAADGYLQAAHYLYYRWGALRKTELMEKTYQILNKTAAYGNITSGSMPSLTSKSGQSDSLTIDFLDMSSVFRASQVISGELVLSKLLQATLDILIENAGAQRGYLVEEKDGTLIVQAVTGRGDLDLDDLPIRLESANAQLLPISLIQSALRTNNPIVIGSGAEQNPYASDPYIQDKNPLSMMFVPLSVHLQSKLGIYMENNLTRGAFSEERIKIIKLLAGQAAISIENARIYEEQEKLLKAQQRFVPIQFLKHLGHNDIAKVALGESVSMEMSVLFSDIRDFTPLVELLSPPEVIEFLNEYYSELGQHISASGGFIDSYAGDEILALFAVPADQAVAAGVKMGESLWKFNRASRLKNRPVLNMGIGVNTGPLVLGTMGGQERMQCTVLGDTVNVASRIESLTKFYGSQFLIGERTFDSLSDPEALSIRMVDRVAVKGKQKAIQLYEVLDAEEDHRRKSKESTKQLLKQGMEDYFRQDFDLALKLFKEGKAMDPEDPIFSIFQERTEAYLIQPPDSDWEGFERLTNK